MFTLDNPVLVQFPAFNAAEHAVENYRTMSLGNDGRLTISTGISQAEGLKMGMLNQHGFTSNTGELELIRNNCKYRRFESI